MNGLKFLRLTFILCGLLKATFAHTDACSKWSWTKSFCDNIHGLWYEGKKELYLSGYAWHNRYTYSAKRIRTYNELALGGGLGKGYFDADGNWHGVCAIAFLDSHKNIEPAVGYIYLKVLHINKQLKLGGGFAGLVTARPDIFKGRPFPGILPWLSLIYGKATVSATYIPGAAGAGNVLYISGKLTIDT